MKKIRSGNLSITWLIFGLESLSRNSTIIEYSDLLSFIAWCQREGDHPKLINRRLSAIRKYYSYLQGTDKTIKNPATGLYLKSKRRGIPKDLLDKADMNKLYENYQVYDLRTSRNKVILSLLINQALTTDELRRLEPVHVKLKAGKTRNPRKQAQ